MQIIVERTEVKDGFITLLFVCEPKKVIVTIPINGNEDKEIISLAEQLFGIKLSKFWDWIIPKKKAILGI